MIDDGAKAIGHRLRQTREKLGWDRPELARRLGVHVGSIARWETGGAIPQAYHLERLAGWANISAQWLRDGSGEEGERDNEPEREAETLFGTFEVIARFLNGIGRPGEQRLRKLDALEGYRRMITTRGPLPDWWYRLREKVERDEL